MLTNQFKSNFEGFSGLFLASKIFRGGVKIFDQILISSGFHPVLPFAFLLSCFLFLPIYQANFPDFLPFDPSFFGLKFCLLSFTLSL